MKIKIVLLIAVYSLVSACGIIGAIPGANKVVGDDGYFRDQKGDYLEAETIPRTKIPDDMDGFIIDDLLVVPEVRSDEVVAYYDVPRPRTISGNPERGVVIQRMNERSWIIVDASASQVWPRIRDYWSASEIGMSFEDPTAGTLDTEWFVVTNNVLTREKFRIKVEPGFQDNSSEITLLHLTAPQATPIGLVPDQWPEVSADPDLEFDFLNRISVYLADVSGLYQATSVSFLAGNIPTDGKASMTTSESGEELLRLNADYDRSWAAVGRALSRAGIEVMSEDRDVGTYDVRYSIDMNEGDKESFLGKVITLNGLLYTPLEDVSEFHTLQIQLWKEESTIDVFVESLDPDGEGPDNLDEVQESLLEAIRRVIA